MERPFIYNTYVTGNRFYGRKADCTILANLLTNGEHVVIYEPPKTGKMSLIQQTLLEMRTSGKQYIVCNFDMFNIRTIEALLTEFGTAILKQVYSTTSEYEEAIARYLSDTHFTFDLTQFSAHDEIVSLTWEPDENDIHRLFSLPQMIAQEKGIAYFVIINNFQNALLLEDEDGFLKTFDMVLADSASVPGTCSYILAGCMVNAMKYIFEENKYFHRHIEHLKLREVDDRQIIEYVVKGFLQSGKVIDRDLTLGICKLLKHNLWYIHHFISICDSMSRGYINSTIYIEALKTLVSIHEPRFISMINDLTDYQLRLLKAVLDGETHFSSTNIIEKYKFNSSANVKRLKEALQKKEILRFDDKDIPQVIDPLFEYWLIKYYFKDLAESLNSEV